MLKPDIANKEEDKSIHCATELQFYMFSKIPDEWIEELNNAIQIEHERAIRQRDEFIKTGISTASHGGSHDTCFKFIIKEHLKKLQLQQTIYQKTL